MCEDTTTMAMDEDDINLVIDMNLIREEVKASEKRLNDRLDELAKLVMAIDTHTVKPHSIPDNDVQKQIRAWGPIYSEAIVTQEGNIYRVSNVRLTLEQIEQFTAQRKPVSAPPPPAPC